MEVVDAEITAGLMKRMHRRWHRLLWPLLMLCAAAVVGLALFQRPAILQNPDWPASLAPAST